MARAARRGMMEMLEKVLVQRWCSGDKLDSSGGVNDNSSVPGTDPLAFFCLGDQNSSFAIALLAPCV